MCRLSLIRVRLNITVNVNASVADVGGIEESYERSSEEEKSVTEANFKCFLLLKKTKITNQNKTDNSSLKIWTLR